jgi:DNA (cytosine-5)-methyltransferase 1
MEQSNIIDLFAGVGGLSIGFEKAGFNVTAAVEFDQQIAETYKENHKKVDLFVEDIKSVADNELLLKYKPDIIVGGPPCQGFSMAGARIRKKFIDDPRNILFKDYFKVVKQLKPKFFLFENVKGLLTMEKGKIFNTIIDMFSDEEKLDGDKYYMYHDIFKASNFGIPQGRERVIIIGSLNKELNFHRIIEETKIEISKEYPDFFKSTTVWDAISNLKGENALGEIKNIKSESQYQEFLSSPNNMTTNHIKPTHDEKTLNRIKQINEGENWTKLNEKIKSVHSGSYGRLELNGIAPTITTRFDTPSGGRFIHPIENRTLSPREGARIQSFPDYFKFVGSKSSIYKQIGNAVPPKLAFFLARVIRNAQKEL